MIARRLQEREQNETAWAEQRGEATEKRPAELEEGLCGVAPDCPLGERPSSSAAGGARIRSKDLRLTSEGYSMGDVADERTGDERRTTVSEAAEILGISAEAVRGRIRRGTIPVEREGGTVYVLIEETKDHRTTGDRSRTTDDRPGDRTDLLIAELQDRVRSLEEANRENRRIIAALTSRIPAIEAPQEAREAPQTVAEEPEKAEPRPATGGAEEGVQRPWWRRVFGG